MNARSATPGHKAVAALLALAAAAIILGWKALEIIIFGWR